MTASPPGRMRTTSSSSFLQHRHGDMPRPKEGGVSIHHPGDPEDRPRPRRSKRRKARPAKLSGLEWE
jgi:hypothetical protein